MEIEDTAYEFSVRIAEIVRYLKEDGKGFPLNDKLLDFGIGAGLSVRERNWETAAGHVRQADYILEMAAKSGYLAERQSLPIRAECAELLTKLTEAEKCQRKSL